MSRTIVNQRAASPLPSGSSQPGLDRRAFVAGAAEALLGVTVIGSALAGLEGCRGNLTGGGSTTPITVSVSGLTADGQAIVTQSAGPANAPLVVVRKSAATYAAYAMVCTPAGCVINSLSGGIMLCPCHGAEFDLNGNAVRGPASSPLQQYATSYNATAQSVTITFV